MAEFETSGLPQKQFVARHGLSLRAFQYRRYKKSQRSSVRSSEGKGPPQADFLPVEVVASPPPHAREGLVELALPRGLLLRFSVGTDTGYIAYLLSALS